MESDGFGQRSGYRRDLLELVSGWVGRRVRLVVVR